MILAGEVHDEETVPVTAGVDGLVVGNRVAGSARPEKRVDAVVH
jgi:ATP-dependent Clp protease ATP-binding subunit ClpB